MSNSIGMGDISRHKSIAQLMSPSVPENGQAQYDPRNITGPVVQVAPSAIVVGDLNVQLPDTLLWKRRWVEIDGQGNLVLTLSKSNNHPRGVTKKYHLTEIKVPFLPDQDRQEMPNSVIVDFLDGRTMQVACEDLVARAQCLKGASSQIQRPMTSH